MDYALGGGISGASDTEAGTTSSSIVRVTGAGAPVSKASDDAATIDEVEHGAMDWHPFDVDGRWQGSS